MITDLEDEPPILVVGALTEQDTYAMMGENADRTLYFCITEDQAGTVDLMFAWGVPKEVWCVTPFDELPEHLLAVIKRAHDMDMRVEYRFVREKQVA